MIVLAEALASICLHIAAREFDYEADSYADCFFLMEERGFFKCSKDLAALVRMRNLLVYRYWRIDDELVYRSVVENFKCVEEFLKSVEERYEL